MRCNNLTDAARPAALFAPGTVRTRTFDTPEPRGITVHELKRLARRKDSPLDSLTPREREVLKLMAEGHDNATIARTLVVTERAVSKHIGNVFLKLGLPTGDSGHRRVLAELAYLDNR